MTRILAIVLIWPVTLAAQRIAVSQLGFLPSMKKQFTSPVPFSSFQIRRAGDGGIAFTGGSAIRSVTSALVGGSTIWIGDFTDLSSPGRYKVVVDSAESFPFDIGLSIYDPPLRAVQLFFYYQRAFTSVDIPYAEGPWVHASDADKAPPGVVKGWHDAGNYAVYMPTMTQSIFWLLEVWSDFTPLDDSTNIAESGNGVPDLLDEARWGLEWVRSMQDSNGGFWGSACPGCNNVYTYGSSFPTDMLPYCKAAAPTVQNTAKAVAVLAYASVVYDQYDHSFAASCLSAAQRGWNWMTAHPGSTDDSGPCGSYIQGSDPALLKTHQMWADAALLYATGSSVYETAFENDRVPIGGISAFNKSEGFAASLYLRVRSGANSSVQTALRNEIFAGADVVRASADSHPFGFATEYYWGCTGNGMHRSGQFSWRAFELDSTRTADRDQTLLNLDYIFGRNFYNLCFVSGIAGITNGRQHGFHEWMKALNASPWQFPGGLAAGPNQSPEPNDNSYPYARPYPVWGYWGDPENPRSAATPVEGRFTDNDSWSTNEVAINWNAALLYNLYAARKVASADRIDAAVESPYTLPLRPRIRQNFPNPFNTSTMIEYDLPSESQVRITVFDAAGRLAKVLLDAQEPAGTHRVRLDLTSLSSGVYFCRLQAGSFSDQIPLQFLK